MRWRCRADIVRHALAAGVGGSVGGQCPPYRDPRFAAFCKKVGLPTTTDAVAM